MNQPKMIENEKDLDCQGKHKLPISMVVLDPKLRSNQRLLCQQCIDDYETDAKTIGFKKVIQMLEDNRKKLLETLEVIIKQNIQNVELFQTQVYNLKSNLIQQLDHMIGNTKDWISNLQSAGSKYREYSFYEELDSIVMNQSSAYKDQINLSNQINMLYDTWNTKINSKLEIFKSFQEYKKCKDILNNLTQQSQRVEQISSNPTINHQQFSGLIILKSKQVRIYLQFNQAT
ncbi:unnamed protein product [Paramecium sonneborni]|uniref:Uncharacterized protein n=1 Tax=Paramecium sonneborni TaxID=65129 RepID=A0A8S1MQN2_9CILI|nr:unnamed protein product [Paramecium sonneborni]